ncbi:MAG: hypothetical protein DYG88_08460, partial [Chloroflexi bacterium CFX4]|nr:hypothetical protein [Chloroflexi bacterium CFX4]
MAKQLPINFVRREREIREVRDALLRSNSENPVVITAALVGAGGFGKTALAIAICHEATVKAYFSDGILWVTLGDNLTEENLKERLRTLIWNVSAVKSEAESLESLWDELRKKLEDGKYLLVIDDIWDTSDLDPFLQVSEVCSCLLTTRFDKKLPKNAVRVHVSQMTPAEGYKLLASDLSPHRDDQQKRLEALAKRLGYQALFLKIINRTLHDYGENLTDGLSDVEQGLTTVGVGEFTNPDDPDERNRTLDASLGVALKRLDGEDTKRFFELVVFAGAVNVPLEAVRVLWKKTGGIEDLSNIRTLCRRLNHLALLENLDLGTDGSSAERPATLRLHDVIRLYLQGKQRETLPSLHTKFLSAYGVTTWADLPADEPYLWDYLAYHLLEANQRDELRAILLDYRYLQAKLNVRDVNALLSDFDAYLKEDDDKAVRLVRGAIEMSAHVLSVDQKALAHQLYGRLYSHRELSDVVNLRQYIEPKLPLSPLGEPTHMQTGGHLLRTLAEHKKEVWGVLVLTNGRLLSWSEDKTLRLWTADRTMQATLAGHDKGVRGALELHDGRLLSWSEDKTLRLWTADGTMQATLAGHDKGVRGALELHDG